MRGRSRHNVAARKSEVGRTRRTKHANNTSMSVRSRRINESSSRSPRGLKALRRSESPPSRPLTPQRQTHHRDNRSPGPFRVCNRPDSVTGCASHPSIATTQQLRTCWPRSIAPRVTRPGLGGLSTKGFAPQRNLRLGRPNSAPVAISVRAYCPRQSPSPHIVSRICRA